MTHLVPCMVLLYKNMALMIAGCFKVVFDSYIFVQYTRSHVHFFYPQILSWVRWWVILTSWPNTSLVSCEDGVSALFSPQAHRLCYMHCLTPVSNKMSNLNSEIVVAKHEHLTELGYESCLLQEHWNTVKWLGCIYTEALKMRL